MDKMICGFNLMLGDCLEKMTEIGDKSVDAIICDLPFGVTACKWDSIIPFEPLWEQYNRVIKDNGVIVLFGAEPFSSALRMSNIKQYKYDWIWKKNKPQGFLNAKKMPLKDYENISVFAKSTTIYNPQGLIKIDKVIKNGGTKNPTSNKANGDKTSANNAIKNEFYKQENTNYPTQVIEFKNSGSKQVHPTQKPVALLEYLIKTYTNEGEIVLDNTFGSCSTGVAAVNTNRKFIGIEMDEKYFNIACDRIEEAIREKELDLFKDNYYD